MNLSILNKNFPIFICKNFHVIDDLEKEDLIKNVLKNKKMNHYQIGGNFPITYDPNSFFKNLYNKFFIETNNFFANLNISYRNSKKCWIYCSNNVDCGPGRVHNHMKTSTINGVYYINVPKSANEHNGSIEFFHNQNSLTYKPNNFDLLLFPNYLDHKINFLNDKEYRISVNMEICCDNDPKILFEQNSP